MSLKNQVIQCLRCLQTLPEEDARYGLHQSCFTSWFKSSPDDEFLSLQKQASSSHDPNLRENDSTHNTSFFHGMFRKYSADLGGASFILKMRQDNAPELPEVEYVCNQIGSHLGLPVAEHFIINFLDDQVFVTKNFIKKGSGSTLDHIYKYLPEGQEYNCENLIRIIAEQTKRPFHVETFVQTVLFDALVGNHDRHGRNLGFINMHSSVVLSPIYDNVSYLGTEHGQMLKADFNPKGKIGTMGNPIEPEMKDYVQEFRHLGHEDVVKSFQAKVKISKIVEIIEHSFCSDLMKNALKRMVKKRFTELENALT